MIDEKKLIEVLNRQKHFLTFENSNPIDEGFNYGIDKAIQLVSVQQKVGEWIPVEERLPNEEEFEKNYCRNHWGAEFIVMIKGANRPTSLYYKEGVWFDDNNNDYDVIAWQPLPEFPEPYSSGD